MLQALILESHSTRASTVHETDFGTNKLFVINLDKLFNLKKLQVIGLT